MTSVKRKCHMKALAENLELGLIGGLLASGVDSLWVVMDMLHNGVHWHYIIILIGLTLSTIVLTIALIRHHKSNVKNQLGVMYTSKLAVVKRKMKRAK